MKELASLPPLRCGGRGRRAETPNLPPAGRRPSRLGQLGGSKTGAAALALLFTLAACGGRSHETGAPLSAPEEMLFAPHLMAVDAASPYNDFGGSGGSILLGDGWSPVQRASVKAKLTSLHRDQGFYAWAIDGTSRLYVEPPEAEELDFVAECSPFSHASLGPQEMTLKVAGREVARTELSPGWQELRLPLPRGAFGRGWYEMALEFRYAARPMDVEESTDKRRLAARFRSLALVPRQVDDPRAFRHAAHFEAAERRLTLPRGGSATLPLPAASELGIPFAAVDAACSGCRLRLELETGAGPAQGVWEGDPSAARRSFTFTTPARPPSRLRISVDGGSGAPYDSASTVAITFGEVSVRRRPQAEQPARRPHVFIYMVDTLRPDTLGPYGSAIPTPHIDAFARDAVVYEDVWSPSSWTLPAVVSVLTGTYPHRHRVSFGLSRIDPALTPTLASLLSAEGFSTVGVSHSFIAGDRFGVDQGFNSFFLSNQLNGERLHALEANSYLWRWLFGAWGGERPIFAYVHTVDPHAPYTPWPEDLRRIDPQAVGLSPRRYHPQTFMRENLGGNETAVALLRARYDAQVVHVDRAFGRFLQILQELGLYDDSIVVLLSDHGEEFAEHGAFDHGRAFYEEMLQVPLIVKYPGSEWGGTVVEAPVSTLDLFPTLLERVGATAAAAPDGESLLPADGGDGRGGHRLTYAEVETESSELLAAVSYRSLRIGATKCIENLAQTDQFGEPAPAWEVFDLAEDPRERSPLPSDDPRAERCRRTLARWLELREAIEAESLAPGLDVDAETREKLRALGYVGN